MSRCLVAVQVNNVEVIHEWSQTADIVDWKSLPYEFASSDATPLFLMAANDYFSHDSQDGRSPFDRIKAAGYSFGAAAENIAAGGTTAAGAMDQWMNSPGHKANILNCTYVDLGVGFAKGVNADYAGYWTQDFGKQL